MATRGIRARRARALPIRSSRSGGATTWSTRARRSATCYKLSFESIREGALITARAGETLRIRISDVDSLKNDLIEEFELSVDELRVGDQVREGTQGLESVTLRVIPRDSQELKHLIQ
jgi:hypothetical protein